MAQGLIQLAALTVGLAGVLALVAALAASFSGTVRRTRRKPPVDLPANRPLELVAADLRRLARELAVVPAGVPQVRRLGLQAAYDDVLTEAAAQLEVPHLLSVLAGGPQRDRERQRLQGALAVAGLDPR